MNEAAELRRILAARDEEIKGLKGQVLRSEWVIQDLKDQLEARNRPQKQDPILREGIA